MKQHIFLYGTLLPGQAPAEVADAVRKLRRVGAASVCGRLYDLGEYPGAILDSSVSARITGEVFELPTDDTVLSALDSYEGYDQSDPNGSLFVRALAPVRLRDGRRIKSWVYVYNRNPGRAPLIANGDYKKSRAA